MNRCLIDEEVGRVISESMAIATKIGQQHNPDAALRILMTAELRLLRKALSGPDVVQTLAQTRSTAWQVQPETKAYPTSQPKREVKAAS